MENTRKDIERTFVAIKPDGVERKLVGEIISRFEKIGFRIIGLRMTQLSPEIAELHYAEHVGKDFFPGLVSFITSQPLVLLALELPRAIEIVRKTIGSTDPLKASPGSVRGDFAFSLRRNVVHASADEKSAQRELALFFPELSLEKQKN